MRKISNFWGRVRPIIKNQLLGSCQTENSHPVLGVIADVILPSLSSQFVQLGGIEMEKCRVVSGLQMKAHKIGDFLFSHNSENQ